MGAEIANVKKFDIRNVGSWIAAVRTLPHRVTITSKSLSGRLWTGRFEANITTVTMEVPNDERR